MAGGGVPSGSGFWSETRRTCCHSAEAPDAVFVELGVAPETLARRLGDRPDHFMPAALLDSQLDAWEPLRHDEVEEEATDRLALCRHGQVLADGQVVEQFERLRHEGLGEPVRRRVARRRQEPAEFEWAHERLPEWIGAGRTAAKAV